MVVDFMLTHGLIEAAKELQNLYHGISVTIDSFGESHLERWK